MSFYLPTITRPNTLTLHIWIKNKTAVKTYYFPYTLKQKFKKKEITKEMGRVQTVAMVSVPSEDRSYRWPESWLWWWRRWQPLCGFWSATSLGEEEKHTRTSPRRWSWWDTQSRAESPRTDLKQSSVTTTSTTSGGPAWRSGPGSGSRSERRQRRTSHRPGTDRTGTGSFGPSDLHRRRKIAVDNCWP